MTRDRFFKLRQNLKVVFDNDISEEERKADAFWKVRPFMVRILNGCLCQDRPESVSIDEQMIPFTGACPYRQYVPLKPNPVHLKNFVVASPDGIILDFDVYRGAPALAAQVQDSEGLGLGSLVVERLAKTLPAGTKVYCDWFFTSVKTLDRMLEKKIYVTGTVMKSQIRAAAKKLPSDKTMKRQGRGSTAYVTRKDGKACLLKWYDNKPVMMLSTVHAKEPQDTCRRWCKKEGRYIPVIRPSIVREYNAKMGGVDLNDRMISYHRMKTRTRKWPLRMTMHFMDLALANSWLLYRKDQRQRRVPEKRIMQFLEFRMEVARAYLAKQGCDEVKQEQEDDEPHKDRRFTPLPPVSVRIASAGHLPDMVDLKNPMRCRLKQCTGKSRVRCVTCNVFLCLQTSRNCYAAFHSK
ncbi:piggyBac transposable element-derived protein 3-like [Diretmus argenteus]